MLRQLVALTAACAMGCSYFSIPAVTVDGTTPPTEAARVATECTDNSLAPRIDLGMAASAGLSGIVMLAVGREHEDCELFNGCHTVERKPIIIGVGGALLVLGVALLGSAYIGHERLGACRVLKAKYAPQPVYAPTYGPPQPYPQPPPPPQQ